MILANLTLEDTLDKDLRVDFGCDATSKRQLITISVTDGDGLKWSEGDISLDIEQLKILHSFLGVAIPLLEKRENEANETN